jgi:hypothetical protein
MTYYLCKSFEHGNLYILLKKTDYSLPPYCITASISLSNCCGKCPYKRGCCFIYSIVNLLLGFIANDFLKKSSRCLLPLRGGA